jgi:hypothetical protein
MLVFIFCSLEDKKQSIIPCVASYVISYDMVVLGIVIRYNRLGIDL